LKQQIEAVFVASKQAYGSPRVYRTLVRQGVCCSENRVARLMREQGLQAKKGRRRRRTTIGVPTVAAAQNVLDRCFRVGRPNQVWTADITYLWTRQGWLYLATLMDLYSRRIVGWSMQPQMGTPLVASALEMALASRTPAQLHHSDRGKQYASAAYRERLRAAGIEGSMNRSGNCWDNAPMESFFASLKCECVGDHLWERHEQARADGFRYIEGFYNRHRLHSSLGYLSPEEYEQAFELEQKDSLKLLST